MTTHPITLARVAPAFREVITFEPELSVAIRLIGICGAD